MRYLTVYPQQFVPGDRTKVLLPLVFCRECGQEYYCVKSKKTETPASSKFEKRELSDLHREENALSGFLYFSNTDPWPRDLEAILDRLPEDWIEESPSGRRVKRNRRDHLPRAIQLGLDGTEDKNGLEGQYIPAPFRFCLRCGVSYAFRQGTDFAKLSSLSSEGRSTATTILSMSMVRSLRKEQNLNSRARKLLSFTDNRQDASLQAGHFNDFVAIGLLRAALYRAANKAGEIGLSHEELADKVFEAIDLPIQLYAQGNSSPKFQKLVETQRALRVVLAYRLYQDLKRGWRIVSQNLEQCGLIEIQYKSLYELCEAEEEWQGKHPALVSAKPATRAKVSKVLLDYMRRELAIKVDYLDRIYQDRLKQLSSQHLCEPWAIDENEELEYARTIFPNKDANRKDEPGYFYLTARGGFGQYLRRGNTFEDYLDKINLKEANIIIGQLFKALEVAGLVQVVVPPDDDKDVPGYQLAASSLLWKAADGTKSFQDPIRVPRISSEGGKTNPFFVNFYRNMGLEIQGFEAREHTAQVQADLRIKREEQFAEAKLPILYCSPTMELGVDIRELNAVNLRKIPPTPANYAQRSGRAGRSGQPALVFSYCTTGSPHDQYFFKRPTRMVAGAVSPPRMDLVNEDLVLAHLHSVWLAETGLYLGSTLKDLLDLSGDTPSLAFLPSVQAALTEPLFRQRALNRVKHILDTLELELKQSDWFNEKWAEDALDKVALSFDQACDRWRGMYRAALSQARAQSKIILDMTRTAEEKNHATRLRAEAEAQLRLLAEPQNIVDSDFNSYRYFASEGFLPGYNFPRLPLSAYIPGKRKTQDRDEFLSRPRFLAISEFGPRSVIYHEGSRYVTNRVILPVGENNELQTRKAKQCDECGYLHPIMDGDGIDKCERRQCGALLGAPMVRLFRLQNVTTKRRDRINSDEEERMRFGYELKTGVRFTEHGGRPSHRLAMIERDGQPIAKMDYGHAATIWRINLGWRRRANPAEWGFLLDIERGYWETNKLAGEEQDDQFGVRTMRVIPFVEDRRNCLLFEPAEEQSVEVMASLASALKNAIQVRYQLEDNELAAEALPSDDKRRLILFYEAAEGGAGVLRSVFDDPAAVQEVAKEALRLCHFNPETGEDLRRSQGAKEDCEAACYDCLMNYSNQRDHGHLDRQKIREMLLELAKCKVSASSAPKPRAEQLLELDRLCDSELERKWLRFLEERDLRLPSRSQILIEACHTRPDFLYDDQLTAIYVDGPPHDFPDRQQRDKLQADAMDDLGYTVIRFHHEADWELIVAQFPSVFGHLHTQGGDGGRS
ncbi:MAG: Zn-binding domain-containing protein [Terriglobia bacterium]